VCVLYSILQCVAVSCRVLQSAFLEGEINVPEYGAACVAVCVAVCVAACVTVCCRVAVCHEGEIHVPEMTYE